MPPSTEAKRLARERASTRRRKVNQIRRTVVAVSLAVFIAAFATIYIQLAAGRDPALTASSGSAVTSTSSGSGATSSSSSSNGSSSSGSSSSDSSSSDSSSSNSSPSSSTDQPSAVTTTQS